MACEILCNRMLRTTCSLSMHPAKHNAEDSQQTGSASPACMSFLLNPRWEETPAQTYFNRIMIQIQRNDQKKVYISYDAVFLMMCTLSFGYCPGLLSYSTMMHFFNVSFDIFYPKSAAPVSVLCMCALQYVSSGWRDGLGRRSQSLLLKGTTHGDAMRNSSVEE